jgi:3D (Asp-Asp-Asp) domain-containing protein
VLVCRIPATFLSATLFVVGFAVAATSQQKAAQEKFTAFAYSIDGTAANGSRPCKGTVSSDPNVLPLGSKIRVSDAGIYSGEYTVVDTGRKVKGHVIDIYVSSIREARQFGKKQVEVEILGSGAHE